ncbi:MAG: AEC family transporter [Caldilineaceae bacterium]
MISALLPIFTETVLPVFLVAAAGVLLATLLKVDHRTLGRTVFYLGTPSLIFRSLYTTQFDWATLRLLATVAASVMVTTGLISWLLSAGLSRRERAAVVLTSAMSNNGNMGMPICHFAFGEAGLALAAIYYITVSFLGNTLGIVVASSGRMSLPAAFREALKAPMLYAAVLGLLFNRMQWELPTALFRSIDLLADAAIPLMLIVLGVQLRTNFKWHSPALVFRSVAIRLLIGPLVAWGICRLLGVTQVEQSVMIIQSSMPTAVITSVVATEFDAAPELVATDIFVSTLLSMVSLSFILWLVMTPP